MNIIANHIESRNVSEKTCKEALIAFLENYLNPAFGALPSREVELLVMKALADLEFIDEEPSLYDLVTSLRITRTKARNLIYAQELRRLSPEALDNQIKKALKNPTLQRQGELFVLDIENPLVIDHLREKLKKHNHAADGSFSPSLVKLSVDAVTVLIEECLDNRHRNEVQQSLIKAGFPDKSFKGIIKLVLQDIMKKALQNSGDIIGEKVGEGIGVLFDGAKDKIEEYFPPNSFLGDDPTIA